MKSFLLNIINLIVDYTWNWRPDSIQSISENLGSLETPGCSIRHQLQLLQTLPEHKNAQQGIILSNFEALK